MKQFAPQILRNLIKERAGVTNFGIITVTAGPVVIINRSLPVLALGDTVLVSYQIKLTKGAVPGDTIIEFNKASGAGVLRHSTDRLANFPLRHVCFNQPALSDWEVFGSAMLYSINPGVYNLEMNGFSAGSNSTVAISDAQFVCMTLRY